MREAEQYVKLLSLIAWRQTPASQLATRITWGSSYIFLPLESLQMQNRQDNDIIYLTVLFWSCMKKGM